MKLYETFAYSLINAGYDIAFTGFAVDGPEEAVPSVAYSFDVPEGSALADVMNNAFANGLTVEVMAMDPANPDIDATCPTTGSHRYMGVAQQGRAFALR